LIDIYARIQATEPLFLRIKLDPKESIGWTVFSKLIDFCHRILKRFTKK